LEANSPHSDGGSTLETQTLQLQLLRFASHQTPRFIDEPTHRILEIAVRDRKTDWSLPTTLVNRLYRAQGTLHQEFVTLHVPQSDIDVVMLRLDNLWQIRQAAITRRGSVTFADLSL
jgi:hypothetical protein